MIDRPPVACLGCGRMARGIAVTFAYAGHAVSVVDVKARTERQYQATADSALGELRTTLRSMARFGLFPETAVEQIMTRISIIRESDAADILAGATVIFECVPEVIALKHEVLARTSEVAGPQPIIASTTSTIVADDLSPAVVHPGRFLNSHYLNPAFLVPLVEVSPSRATDPATVVQLTTLLERIGKIPVVCAARPGFIVPRIQALAMNEAARLVEEGVAAAADIDKAIKYGFGFRFAVLGMLEFIDWGGGDILYHASDYLSRALASDRYAAPEIVARNMREGRIGLQTRKGFLDYDDLDVESYRGERLERFVKLLRHFEMVLPPVLS